MKNFSAILAALQEAGAFLTGPAADQFLQLIAAFEAALPAIEKGIASAEPFILAGFKLLGNGGQPISAEDWAAQLALLQAQITTVDQQVAADEAAQPGN